ncbi:HAD-IA family hydrolase [Micrococcales bacterium 31B]|nr:HAD-IA family hydrolase [Micrococcales bacterium 31B]
MDGTLISSVGAVERSWATAASEFGVGREAFGDFHGMPANQVIERILPDADAATRLAMFERVLHLEVTDTEGVEQLPGAREALETLNAGERRCAIVTSCTWDLAEARIGAAGLQQPRVVVTVDQVTRGKPDPAPYLLGAERLELDPSRCLVVEDATAGLTSGRAAGCATLAVTTSSPRADLEPLSDTVIDDLGAVRFELTEAGVRVHRR